MALQLYVPPTLRIRPLARGSGPLAAEELEHFERVLGPDCSVAFPWRPLAPPPFTDAAVGKLVHGRSRAHARQASGGRLVIEAQPRAPPPTLLAAHLPDGRTGRDLPATCWASEARHFGAHIGCLCRRRWRDRP